MKISPWLSFTPTVGIRGTFYSDGLDAANNSTDSFSRESFDIRAAFEGPKINRVFSTGQGQAPKVKHVIEPRFSYNYIPDIDEDDRDKIKVLDATDAVDPLSRISYSLTQRLLLKRRSGNNEFETHEVLRFEISQSYDLREATGSVPQGGSREPFSDIRFDLDSRLIGSLLLNIDSTYDVHEDAFNTLNFEVGVKPFNSLTLFAERRFIRNDSTFITGTLDWAFQKSWRFQASTRYDERRQTFRENNLSLLYDNPCRCWGLGFDYINREIIANGQRENENKFILNLTLRGLGSVRSRDDQQLLHRSF
jgi:lipopolysaccharide assembly outer membrane protein LptD (OstA)